MGKPFGKKPNDWLRLPATISFLETLANARKSRNSDYQPVITIRGNPDSGGGTWFHEDVAIEYAGWLSDEFKIWCNDRVQRFLNNVKKQKMNEIIKIRELSGRQIISARELHDFLEVGRDFTTWCKQMFEYGFEENKDFTPISVKSTGGRPSTDYALTLDCGKEIAMIQRTPKGKQARNYFIVCEKKYRQIKAIDTPEAIMAKALLMAKDTMDRQEKQPGWTAKGFYKNKILHLNNINEPSFHKQPCET